MEKEMVASLTALMSSACGLIFPKTIREIIQEDTELNSQWKLIEDSTRPSFLPSLFSQNMSCANKRDELNIMAIQFAIRTKIWQHEDILKCFCPWISDNKGRQRHDTHET